MGEVNKLLKVYFNDEKDKSEEGVGTDYDWRTTIKKAPTVNKFDYSSCDIPMMMLSYSGSVVTFM